jgi:hypothetical protein
MANTINPNQYVDQIAEFLNSNPVIFKNLDDEEYIETIDFMIDALGIPMPVVSDHDDLVDLEIENYHDAWGKLSHATIELMWVVAY